MKKSYERHVCESVDEDLMGEMVSGNNGLSTVFFN